MKNYYEILEVDKNASKEVIEKAYRTLAKKYHPDLQQGAMKQVYAEKMKIINEAYDVLSDDFKRTEYNEKQQEEQQRSEGISKEQQERIMQENYELKQQLNMMENQQINKQVNQCRTKDEGSIINMSKALNEQIEAARRQAYNDAYIEDMRNRGYTIRYKRDFKYYLKLIKIILITILLCFIMYQIPPIKQFFQDLYNENIIFQAIVDIFKNTFSSPF